jgi:hypothetical protein
VAAGGGGYSCGGAAEFGDWRKGNSRVGWKHVNATVMGHGVAEWDMGS